MKRLPIILLFLLIITTAYCADVTGPEPAPWWLRVEDAQALAVKWLAALTVIAGALAGFVSYVLGQVNTIKSNQRAHDAQLTSHGQQITTIAMSAAPPSQTITQNNPPATPP